jgi:hypothetical protein
MIDELESLRRSACIGKAQHKTYHAAIRQQRKGKRTAKGLSKTMKISAYHCKFCGFYHVGHQAYKR